jgi:hypothetical protein
MAAAAEKMMKGMKAMKAMTAMKTVKKDISSMKAMKAHTDKKETQTQRINRVLGNMRAGGMAQAKLADLAKHRKPVDVDVSDSDDAATEIDSDSDDVPATKKRPAAARGAAASVSGAYEEKGWRNRGKTKALKRMEENGELPSDIATWLKGKRTKETTKFVNECIEKVDGKWQLKLDAPMLDKARTQYDDQSERLRIRTVPPGKAAFEWGGDVNLQKGLQAGHCWENGDGSISWKEGSEDTTTGEKKSTTLSGSKKLSSKQHAALDQAMNKLGWKTVAPTMQTASKTQVRMLAGEELPSAVKETLDDVQLRVILWNLYCIVI